MTLQQTFHHLLLVLSSLTEEREDPAIRHAHSVWQLQKKESLLFSLRSSQGGTTATIPNVGHWRWAMKSHNPTQTAAKAAQSSTMLLSLDPGKIQALTNGY